MCQISQAQASPVRSGDSKSGGRALLPSHPFAPHLTAVWLTLGYLFPTSAAVAVFGIVLNLNFPLVLIQHMDYNFGRDLIRNQWRRLGKDVKDLPYGTTLDFLVVVLHVLFHVAPAWYFLQVCDEWRVRDVVLSACLVPLWCSFVTGSLARGKIVPWCNCSNLYAARSTTMWQEAFATAYRVHYGLILFPIFHGRI